MNIFHKKSKRRPFLTIIAIGFICILFMIPISTENHGYQAVLWGFEREHVILEENVGGIDGHTRYYNNFRIRILCFFMTVEHAENVRVGQW